MKGKVFHIFFWLLIGLLISFLFGTYLYFENKSLSMSGLPLFTVIIQILVAEKIVGKNKYYPTSIFEYISLNTIFFIMFILVLFLLDKAYVNIKIGAFIIMTLIGLYNTYFLFYNNSIKK